MNVALCLFDKDNVYILNSLHNLEGKISLFWHKHFCCIICFVS